jgi:hypothetical protein
MTCIMDLAEPDSLCYVDSDMYFWGDCAEIEKELGEDSILVTPYNKDYDKPPSHFNAGCFGCRNDQNAREFLAWWQERCLEWCLWLPTPDGRFVDEGYLTVFRDNPDWFDGVKVNQHPGINLAHWNVGKHTVVKDGAGFKVDGEFPLVCFHYQGLVKGETYQPFLAVTPEISELLYHPYYDLLPLPWNHGDPDPNWVPISQEDLVQFPLQDGDIELQITTYGAVPQNLLSMSKLDPTVKTVMSKTKDDALTVLIKYMGLVVGFFTPCGVNGMYGMPIFIDPIARNREVGRRVISMYMTGKKGVVAIAIKNKLAQKAFIAAGFRKMYPNARLIEGAEMEIWTNEEI